MSSRPVWRVGPITHPLGFAPREPSRPGHRFDDPDGHFRTIYCAEDETTALREVLADFRPNLQEVSYFLSRFGEDARAEIPRAPVTAAWRSSHVLAPALAELDGPIVDLTDPAVRRDLEAHHAQRLLAHGLEHLDLHEITTQRREITQAIARDAHSRLGAAAIRYPSRLDGRPCLAIFEGHGALVAAGDPITLTDPAPQALIQVCAEWEMELEPAPR